MENPANYFIIAMLVAFVATLPFGPINLSVIKTTVDHHRLGAIELSIAAAVVEAGQALIAVLFGLVINAFLDRHPSLNLVIAAAFIGLAIYVYIHDSHPSLNSSSDDPSFIRRGLLVAAINPQAVPFWIFAVTAINQYLGFNFQGGYLAFFLGGLVSGKLIALYGFIVASDYLKTHLDESSRLVNHLLAVVLFIIGLVQIWRFFAA